MKEEIIKRINELEKEIQEHQLRINSYQQEMERHSRALISKRGAVIELSKLGNEKKKVSK